MKANTQKSTNRRGRLIGQDHPRARYTDGEVSMVLALADQGWRVSSIVAKLEMPRRTVRDIISGRIRQQREEGA